MEQSEILQYLAELTGIEGHAFHRAILLEVVVWFVMIAAVIIDFSTGIRKARVLKIPSDKRNPLFKNDGNSVGHRFTASSGKGKASAPTFGAGIEGGISRKFVEKGI